MIAAISRTPARSLISSIPEKLWPDESRMSGESAVTIESTRTVSGGSTYVRSRPCSEALAAILLLTR